MCKNFSEVFENNEIPTGLDILELINELTLATYVREGDQTSPREYQKRNLHQYNLQSQRGTGGGKGRVTRNTTNIFKLDTNTR